jgi:hypothetical protein
MLLRFRQNTTQKSLENAIEAMRKATRLVHGLEQNADYVPTSHEMALLLSLDQTSQEAHKSIGANSDRLYDRFDKDAKGFPELKKPKRRGDRTLF